MFGYIKPLKDELKIREYRLYRSYYCGFCKYLGREWGLLSRLFLSNDIVFLSLLLSSLEEGEETTYSRCLLYPPRFSIIKDEKIFKVTAPIGLLLFYNKLKNDLVEERSFRKHLAQWMLRGKIKKIASQSPALVLQVERELACLQEREEACCDNLDESAEPFARLLGYLFREGGGDERQGRILEWIGFNLGKWIYLLDAFDDLEEDQAKGEYNPLLSSFGYQGGDLEAFQGKIEQDVHYLLHVCLRQMLQAFHLLGIKKNRGLLENILKMGLYHMEEIVMGGSCEHGKRSVRGPWYQKGCL